VFEERKGPGLEESKSWVYVSELQDDFLRIIVDPSLIRNLSKLTADLGINLLFSAS
jgi:hypothetical protein